MVKVNESYDALSVPSSLRMKALGARVARAILRERKRRSLVVLLEGELGSGKTTFAQGFVRELSGRTRVLSPTFLLMKEYPLMSEEERGRGVLYHFDWYRVADRREVEGIGWKSILADPRNIVLVEWPERAPGLLGKDAVKILFFHKSATERVVRVPSFLCA